MTDLGAVPQDMVDAGAPANFNEWTEEQKNAYFKQAPVQQSATGDQDNLAVAEMQTGEDGGEMA